jgi:hypothetical protein
VKNKIRADNKNNLCPWLLVSLFSFPPPLSLSLSLSFSYPLINP